MFKAKLFASAALGVAMIAATPASAEILVYQASNYAAGPGQHGLWTNNIFAGANNYFAFQPDMRLTIDTATGLATFKGTAINPAGNVATIDMALSNFLETTQGSAFAYKQESGGAYDPLADAPDVDFFTFASGSITIDGLAYNLQASPFPANYTFQYGEGANAKNGAFGGSSWLLTETAAGFRPDHWDVNFNLTAVPEPSTWAMMIFGFGLTGAAMRRRKTIGKAALA
ncbi:MAG: PEPxxWA-CTERM sorting domain-containing protein [Parasphingorhabdus sp.]|nr:PEPxxWA-CTERM sorting domain-containing protein [Parasphingorhabdus sp.]